MPDMLVKLYNLPEFLDLSELNAKGVQIKHALAPDRHNVMDFVRSNFSEGWASECDAAFSNHPISCFVAVKDAAMVGFACYDATARGYFGPLGVLEGQRGLHIGKYLLLKTLIAMRDSGYGYSIIGWTDVANDFYARHAGATLIEDSSPGIYRRLIGL